MATGLPLPDQLCARCHVRPRPELCPEEEVSVLDGKKKKRPSLSIFLGLLLPRLNKMK